MDSHQIIQSESNTMSFGLHCDFPIEAFNDFNPGVLAKVREVTGVAWAIKANRYHLNYSVGKCFDPATVNEEVHKVVMEARALLKK